jgi:hypothetical protein
MANIYVRSTDGSDADGGSTWALAKATIGGTNGSGGAFAIEAAGDTIWVSQSHTETVSANWSAVQAGTRSNPVKLMCGNDAAEPPTALTTGAKITSTAVFGAIGFVTDNASIYVYGIEFEVSGAGGSVVIGSQLCRAFADQCTFWPNGSSLTVQLVNGVFKDCVFRYGTTTAPALLRNCTVTGGSIHASSGNPANGYFKADDGDSVVEGFDFSTGSSAAYLTALLLGDIVLRNCKLPASWSGALIHPTTTDTGRISMYNCDNADTNYKLWIETSAGSIKEETTRVRTGGASDGTTPLSWKMTTNSDAAYPNGLVISDETVSWNESTGASKTVTVEILHDSATALKDDEIWLEVQYLGTSGVPLGSFIDDAKADVLATAADQTTSSATWTTTGMSNPNKQKLSVTFTPQEKGYILAVVKMAKASYTVYVCPKMEVT